jgi:hypothetical protein
MLFWLRGGNMERIDERDLATYGTSTQYLNESRERMENEAFKASVSRELAKSLCLAFAVEERTVIRVVHGEIQWLLN